MGGECSCCLLEGTGVENLLFQSCFTLVRTAYGPDRNFLENSVYELFQSAHCGVMHAGDNKHIFRHGQSAVNRSVNAQAIFSLQMRAFICVTEDISTTYNQNDPSLFQPR